MLIIETSIFTKQVLENLKDDEYRRLQEFLRFNPDVGNIIQHSGGLRKIRWSTSGHVKRGGVRIIYYFITKRQTILMLFLYKKNQQDNLTSNNCVNI